MDLYKTTMEKGLHYNGSNNDYVRNPEERNVSWTTDKIYWISENFYLTCHPIVLSWKYILIIFC